MAGTARALLRAGRSPRDRNGAEDKLASGSQAPEDTTQRMPSDSRAG